MGQLKNIAGAAIVGDLKSVVDPAQDQITWAAIKAEYLVDVMQRLSLARSLDEITTLVRHAARELVDADGATFVLRDGEFCHYVDEEAIEPLWKGKRFPLQSCVSGWVMAHDEVAAIEDIYVDPRVPISAYRPTFVKSLVMTPIRSLNPIGAIGTYWADNRRASAEEIKLLKVLANSSSIALENVRIVSDLQKSNDALSESLRSRDEFLSIAAHELRTPLSALKLQLQMTGQDLEQGNESKITLAEVKDDLAMALRQTNKLEDLTEQLLDISRIQLNKFDLQFVEFDLDDAVSTVLDHLSLSIQEAGCEVRLTLSRARAKGHWDRLRIEQVITNLISNAYKYAPGTAITITVTQDEADMVLTVSDEGGGVPVEAREKIFERFVRGTSSDHVSGLGLGLSIVKNIVRAHDGQITVSGDEGKGATFTMRIPLDPFLKEQIGNV